MTALSRNREIGYVIFAASTILIAFAAVCGVTSAQTFDSQQQPPNFGDFNGTMPSPPGNMPPGDFNGSMGFPNDGMGQGDFDGGFGGPGDGNFTRPDVSGASDGYGEGVGQVTGDQTDYTLIIGAVAAVGVAVAVVAAVLLVRKKRTAKTEPTEKATETDDSQNFDF